jgi:hypothetical protein
MATINRKTLRNKDGEPIKNSPNDAYEQAKLNEEKMRKEIAQRAEMTKKANANVQKAVELLKEAAELHHPVAELAYGVIKSVLSIDYFDPKTNHLVTASDSMAEGLKYLYRAACSKAAPLSVTGNYSVIVGGTYSIQSVAKLLFEAASANIHIKTPTPMSFMPGVESDPTVYARSRPPMTIPNPLGQPNGPCNMPGIQDLMSPVK